MGLYFDRVLADVSVSDVEEFEGDGRDLIGWFGDLTGHEDSVCDGLSWRGGKEEGSWLEPCIGHPGWQKVRKVGDI